MNLPNVFHGIANSLKSKDKMEAGRKNKKYAAMKKKVIELNAIDNALKRSSVKLRKNTKLLEKIFYVFWDSAKKVGKTAITQLEEIAKAQNLDKPIYITIEEKSGPVKNERDSSQTSTVTYYCKIECKFNGDTFEGEAGDKNILIKTNASKRNEAKNLAAEKALLPYDQVDASVNIQTTKKTKTPLGIAIYFNNIIFIGGCISTVFYYITQKLSYINEIFFFRVYRQCISQICGKTNS